YLYHSVLCCPYDFLGICDFLSDFKTLHQFSIFPSLTSHRYTQKMDQPRQAAVPDLQSQSAGWTPRSPTAPVLRFNGHQSHAPAQSTASTAESSASSFATAEHDGLSDLFKPPSAGEIEMQGIKQKTVRFSPELQEQQKRGLSMAELRRLAVLFIALAVL